MNLSAGAVSAKLDALAYQETCRRIEQEFAGTGDASNVQRGLTAAMDDLVTRAYTAVIAPVLPQGAALLAVGEYGRAQLFPYSDVNVLFVLETEASWVALRDVVSEFVRELWEIGLRVNHSVRMVAECLDVRDENLDLKIGLLDRRFLTGDKLVHTQLKNRLPAFLGRQAQKLAQQLSAEARLRHARHQNTIRHLQPDLQGTPGGFQDLQLIRWLARLSSDRPPLLDPLGQPASFLGMARCFLHYRARGDRNTLDFDAQQSIVQQPFARHTTRVEWMREYYGSAAAIANAARRALESCEKTESSLLGNFREWRARLSNTDFTVSRDRLLLRNPSQIEQDTTLLLRSIEFMARHDIQPSASMDIRLAAARPALAAYCFTPGQLWATLKNILALPHIAVALRALQNTGLLSAVFPEWTHIENLNAVEYGHSYTVDEHVLAAAERIGELRTASDPARRRFSELLSEIDNPAVLLFALLYHDMGKDSLAGDSLPVSVARAAAAARRAGMPPDEQSDVEFLIEHQSDLAEGMSGRDPADPATARWLAKRIGTIERLRLLAVLTYADIASLSADSMSPWRMDQLWLVHQVTRHELTRELETDRIQEVPRTLPRQAEFIKGFPVRYLRVHPPAEIEAHLELYELSRPTGVAVQLDREQSAYRMTVVARDMPFLFAALAGALSSFGLDILKAEAFSNAQGLILDTFVFADPKRTLEQNPQETDRLQETIRRVALGKADGQKLLRNRVHPDHKKRNSEAHVQFDSDACETATLVEISADDRPGLLCSLAAVFSGAGCNIDVVLIDTKGHRAIDVFYVAYEGRKLTRDLQSTLQEKLLAAC